MLELECEEFEGQRVKYLRSGGWHELPSLPLVRSQGLADVGPPERMISRKRAAKFESSWFMRFLLAGFPPQPKGIITCAGHTASKDF